MFKYMKQNVRLEHKTSEIGTTREPYQSEPNSNNQECAIRIEGSDKFSKLTERILSLCLTISASQPATDFYYDGARGELIEGNVPVMSKEAKSLVPRWVKVTSSAWNYFLQHESLEVLHLDNITLHDAAVPLIFNHRNLKVLILYDADMSHDKCKYVCHHLGDLVHLEEIDLAWNDLSHVTSIRLSNTTSPVTLKLEHTNMSPELFKSICQLTSVVKLKELDLLGNTLTGQLHHLMCEAHQVSLELLNLKETKINKNDITVIKQAIQGHLLAGLRMLDILVTMEREMEELIRTCVTHHQRELKLILWDNGLSEESGEKWERLCPRTHIELWFGKLPLHGAD